MKNFLIGISAFFFSAILVSCAGNKDLQERVPASFAEVFYTQTNDGLTLNIPVKTIQEQKVSLDAVYFRGMKSSLTRSEEQTNIYLARFYTGSKEMVMSEDPVKEYGNKAPQKPQKSPVSLEKDEALLVFSENGQTKFFKLKGIVEKE